MKSLPVNINLIHNRGFAWFSRRGVHVKGFAFTADGRYLDASALAGYFGSCTDKEDFCSLSDFTGLVSQANGMFTLIVEGKDAIRVAVDRMRSFPLFYTLPGKEGMRISDSVDAVTAAPGERNISGSEKLNESAKQEFLATGFVTGRETLAEGIFQVQASEILEIRATAMGAAEAGGTGVEESEAEDTSLPGLRISPKSIAEASGLEVRSLVYSSYRTAGERSVDATGAMDKLEQLTRNIFERLAVSMKGRTAVIALSGGYDSRLIASMLKELDYGKVVCFSYGREGNPEMKLAERVASGLGFKYIPVVYDAKLIAGFTGDPEFREFVDFTSNRVSMCFLQEYFAIRYLKENKLVPEDSVFIPGHSGDFFAGSQLIKHGLHLDSETEEKTIRRIHDIKYAWAASGADRELFLERIRTSLSDKDLVPDALPYSVHEDWDLKEKLSKFLVNSCNVYGWFGYEYRLPLYDYEFQDFFRDLPFGLKSDKNIYDRYLVERVFSRHDLNFPDELQPGKSKQVQARNKARIKRIIPPKLRPVTVSRQDPIFYYDITGMLVRDLEERGISIKIHGNSYNSLIVQWYIRQI